jgi:hypothetical protein
MPLNFSTFPSEIRNRIYEELLVLSEPIIIEMATDRLRNIRGVLSDANNWFTCGVLGLCPAILLANKRTRREATPLLYCMNSFRVGDSESSYTYETPCAILTLFLDHIGSQNAGFLRRICIAFPIFDDYHAGSVTLQEDSIRALELIRDKCTNLAILKTSLQTTATVELSIDSLDNPRAAAEALALVDTRFKAISSLKEIIVNVYDETPSLDLRDKMRGCGWTITEWEAPESVRDFGSDDDFDGFDDYDYNYWEENPREEEDWWEDYDRRNSSS